MRVVPGEQGRSDGPGRRSADCCPGPGSSAGRRTGGQRVGRPAQILGSLVGQALAKLVARTAGDDLLNERTSGLLVEARDCPAVQASAQRAGRRMPSSRAVRRRWGGGAEGRRSGSRRRRWRGRCRPLRRCACCRSSGQVLVAGAVGDAPGAREGLVAELIEPVRDLVGLAEQGREAAASASGCDVERAGRAGEIDAPAQGLREGGAAVVSVESAVQGERAREAGLRCELAGVDAGGVRRSEFGASASAFRSVSVGRRRAPRRSGASMRPFRPISKRLAADLEIGRHNHVGSERAVEVQRLQGVQAERLVVHDQARRRFRFACRLPTGRA